jgi:hypothetical protein
VGNSAQLAEGYLRTAFGDGPRYSWITAAVFALTTQLFATAFLTEAALAYADGVTAADPGATGTFTWDGIGLFQTQVTYTFSGGHETHVGGALTVFSWVLWIVASICVGRLWRALPWWRRRSLDLAAR